MTASSGGPGHIGTTLSQSEERRDGERNRDRETRREHDRDSAVHWIFFLGSVLGVRNEGLLLRTGRPFIDRTFALL